MEKNEVSRAFFAGSEKKTIQVRACDGAYCETTLAWRVLSYYESLH